MEHDTIALLVIVIVVKTQAYRAYKTLINKASARRNFVRTQNIGITGILQAATDNALYRDEKITFAAPLQVLSKC